MTNPETLRPLWVFAYGSLMWNPGFPVAQHQIARLLGYRRTFCMRSIHHRGTEDAPGLVLALDVAATQCCEGVAFEVVAGAEDATLKALRERELISSAYYEDTLPITLQDGQTVQALCYVVDRDHVQYCSGLDLEEQARIIAQAKGGMGPNSEYLWNTASHLDTLGIADADLAWLTQRVRALV